LYDDLTEEDLEITDLKAGYPPGQLPQTAEASDAIPDTTVSMPPMAYHLFSDLPIQSGKSSDYTVTSTDTDSNDLELSDGSEEEKFWNSQWLNKKSSRKLLRAFLEVLLNGPGHRLPRVRVDPDLASKEDHPNTLFCIIEQSTQEDWSSKDLSLATTRLGGDQTWDTWDLIYKHLQKGWPKGMLMVKEDWSKMVSPYKTSILEHPGHFTGDWTFFEGASVAVKELSFTRFGFPSSEFRRCMQSDGSTMENWSKAWQHSRTPNSLQEASISGRSWYGQDLPSKTWNSG
jgi:hypothetical protein